MVKIKRYKSKKRTRSRKNRTKKNYRRYKMGGHEHEDLPHYHLFIIPSTGSRVEMRTPQFAKSQLDRDVDAATIADIKRYVEDEGLNMDNTRVQKPFTLFWKGKKLEDSAVKLRKIIVDGSKIPLYVSDITEPIVVKLNEDIGDPVFYEGHDIDWRDPDTPR
jgi:hypothetical protein